MDIDKKALRPLIDTDILRYRCGFAADAQIKKEALEAEPDASPERLAEMLMEIDYEAIALQNVKTVMRHVLEIFNPDYQAFISGKENFRKELATIKKYKGNRDTLHKPKYYDSIGDYLIQRWHAKVSVGQEADDDMGIAQCSAPENTTVIVTTDKDLLMIPGWNYNWVKDVLSYVDENSADLMLFYQMLVGDAADNIPGIKGVGDKTAQKLMEEHYGDLNSVRAAVQHYYAKQYGDGWEAAYYEVGNLLWMRREEGQECPIL